MLIRLGHIATLRKYQVLSLYLNIDDTIIVRNTETIKLLNDPSISSTALAMKLAVARRPMHFVCTLLFLLLIMTTYFLRLTEARPLTSRAPTRDRSQHLSSRISPTASTPQTHAPPPPR